MKDSKGNPVVVGDYVAFQQGASDPNTIIGIVSLVTDDAQTKVCQIRGYSEMGPGSYAAATFHRASADIVLVPKPVFDPAV